MGLLTKRKDHTRSIICEFGYPNDWVDNTVANKCEPDPFPTRSVTSIRP